MKSSRAYLLYIIYICLWCSCTHKPSSASDSAAVRNITVSIEPLRFLTEQIAGDAFHVSTLVPKGSSPETYEPSPEQMVDLGRSTIFFGINDLGFERTWLERLRQTAPEVTFVDAATGIQRMNGHRHDHDGSHGDALTDPHVWTSPGNMKRIAQNICQALCQADTAQAGIFKSNLQQTLKSIQTVEDSIRTLLASSPCKTFLIYHPALTYFARDYGLEQLTIEKDGKEPSPRHLAELTELCKTKSVRIIFVQQEFDRKNAELIARETGTRITEINPLSYEWGKEMLKIAQTLHEQ